MSRRRLTIGFGVALAVSALVNLPRQLSRHREAAEHSFGPR
jgi:hypothetical protein